MSVIVFAVCMAIIVSRSRRGARFIAPSLLAVISLIQTVFTAIAIRASFEAVAHASPADRSKIVAAFIGETLSALPVGFMVEGILIGATIVVDRLLQSKPQAIVRQAPDDSWCPQHKTKQATITCDRCGSFACEQCISRNRALCRQCGPAPRTG
jgi:hypothetical protein